MRPVARIAQSVEQGIENPRVLGSIPSPGTKFIFQIHLPNSTKLKYNHIVTSNLNILNSTRLY